MQYRIQIYQSQSQQNTLCKKKEKRRSKKNRRWRGHKKRKSRRHQLAFLLQLQQNLEAWQKLLPARCHDFLLCTCTVFYVNMLSIPRASDPIHVHVHENLQGRSARDRGHFLSTLLLGTTVFRQLSQLHPTSRILVVNYATRPFLGNIKRKSRGSSKKSSL